MSKCRRKNNDGHPKLLTRDVNAKVFLVLGSSKAGTGPGDKGKAMETSEWGHAKGFEEAIERTWPCTRRLCFSMETGKALSSPVCRSQNYCAFRQRVVYEQEELWVNWGLA